MSRQDYWSADAARRRLFHRMNTEWTMGDVMDFCGAMGPCVECKLRDLCRERFGKIPGEEVKVVEDVDEESEVW